MPLESRAARGVSRLGHLVYTVEIRSSSGYPVESQEAQPTAGAECCVSNTRAGPPPPGLGQQGRRQGFRLRTLQTPTQDS